MNKLTTLVLVMLAVTGTVVAHSEHGLAEAQELINKEVPCTQLSEEELALIGDYYMEQMHPGEQHEQMDQRMGGEGSDRLRNMHVAMAQRFYCSSENANPLPYNTTTIGLIAGIGAIVAVGGFVMYRRTQKQME